MCSIEIANQTIHQKTCILLCMEECDRYFHVIPKYMYGSVSAYMHDTLHWLLIAQRILYRIAVLIWRCLLGSAPGYLCDLCRPVSGLPGRRALRSSATGQLLVPCAKTATRQRRAF